MQFHSKLTTVPHYFTLNWTKCNDRLEGPIKLYAQPTALNGKLYVSGRDRINNTYAVLEYTPDLDQWAELPHPPVYNFTIATLRGKLIVVGGKDKSTDKITNTTLIFSEHRREWYQSIPGMPTAVTSPAVIEYQKQLIVAGGRNDKNIRMCNVCILSTNLNRWITAQPRADYYQTIVINDTLYLVGQETQSVLLGHVPVHLSPSSMQWEDLTKTKCTCSSPITIGATLLTVGGTESDGEGLFDVSDIQMYNSCYNQWIEVSSLLEPMTELCCTVILGKLFLLGGDCSRSVYFATV